MSLVCDQKDTNYTFNDIKVTTPLPILGWETQTGILVFCNRYDPLNKIPTQGDKTDRGFCVYKTIYIFIKAQY